MYNYLTFSAGFAKPTISLDNEDIAPIKEEILSLDMIMTKYDYEKIKLLQKVIYWHKEDGYEIRNILLSQDIYLPVFKYMYKKTNGCVIYDYFEDIPITLVRSRMTEFIKILVGNNEDEFIEVLKDMR